MKIDLLKWIAVAVAAAGCSQSVWAQTKPQPLAWSERAARAAMVRWPGGHLDGAQGKVAFKYELGTYLEGIDAAYQNTADARYYNYLKSAVDELVTADGSIPTFRPDEFQLDSILMGRQLLRLYSITGDKRYIKAAGLLYDQLLKQPRTASGGFWHKQRYPNQMWQDGLYMAEPFYAEYARLTHQQEKFADVAKQFTLASDHLRDAKTGLLFHGWDESKQQRWADPATGRSPELWARAEGWTMMALVDTLDYLPVTDPSHAALVKILNEQAAALVKVQDAKSGVWFQVLDKAGEKGNYLESSASSMFVYALAKGVRKGYLPLSYQQAAERGYAGILKEFVVEGPGDDVSLAKTVKVGGLGGSPYRDGTYAYYLSEPVVSNDPKGVGPFIEAAVEVEQLGKLKLGLGRTIIMDGWFNSQKKTDDFGHEFLFHYKWNNQSESGFSMAGRIFENYGAQLGEIDEQPTAERLKRASVYVVVSPDNPAKNPAPHFANQQDAEELAKWVKAGGVLLILENDASFADIEHFNVIAQKFGLHFNNELRKHVVGTDWSMGKLVLNGQSSVFHQPHTLYIKDVCTISPQPGSKLKMETLLKEGPDVFMARARYGKGTVVAFVDPWLYNEYTDGRRLPADYDNYAAGVEFARFVLEQVK